MSSTSSTPTRGKFTSGKFTKKRTSILIIAGTKPGVQSETVELESTLGGLRMRIDAVSSSSAVPGSVSPAITSIMSPTEGTFGWSNEPWTRPILGTIVPDSSRSLKGDKLSSSGPSDPPLHGTEVIPPTRSETRSRTSTTLAELGGRSTETKSGSLTGSSLTIEYWVRFFAQR